MTTLNDTPPEQSINANIGWTNYDNDAFYTAVNVEGLRDFAQKGGLDDGCDVIALKPYWESAASILDVGSGYGRVLETLLKHNFKGKITAIERNKNLFTYLQQHYAERVSLHNIDIHDCSTIIERFDVILFLWGGLADFPLEEQPLIIKQLTNLLANKGLLILELPPLGNTLTKSKPINKQLSSIQINNITVYINVPTSQEILEYANAEKLNQLQTLHIKTSANRPRNIYILGETRTQPLPNKH